MGVFKASLVGTGFLLCFGAFGVVACGDGGGSGSYSAPSKSSKSFSKYSRADLEAEYAKMADSGDETGRLILALKSYEPALYNEFLDAIIAESKSGKSDYDAGYAAGEAMRPKFLEAFGKAILTTNDKNVNDLIDVALETYKHLNNKDPQECVNNINGLPPSSMTVIPVKLQQRESKLMVKTFEDGVDRSARAASQDEVMAWMIPLMTADAELSQGFTNLALPNLTDAQARVSCNGMITLFEDLKKRPAAEVATLFRGMAQMDQ